MAELLSAEEDQARDGHAPPVPIVIVGLILGLLLLVLLFLLLLPLFLVIPPLPATAESTDRRYRLAARGQEKLSVHSACLKERVGGWEGGRVSARALA